MKNNKYKILLVDDDVNISNFITTSLEIAGYFVITAKRCSEAFIMYNSYNPDLVILDLGLPDRDGMEFLIEIRKNNITPIIVLSSRSEDTDKVDALDSGANDYVTKPFSSAELLARIRNALKVGELIVNSELAYKREFILNELVINYDTRQVFLKSKEINLTPTEYNILALLSMYSGKILTYSKIIKEIWGYNDYGSIKKLQVNMVNIRKKLGILPGDENYIINELGVGYRINIPK